MTAVVKHYSTAAMINESKQLPTAAYINKNMCIYNMYMYTYYVVQYGNI